MFFLFGVRVREFFFFCFWWFLIIIFWCSVFFWILCHGYSSLLKRLLALVVCVV